MAHFKFKAKKASGEIYSGEKDASDRVELYRLLRERGEEILEYKEKIKGQGLKMNITWFSRVKTIEKINMARNLGAMLKAGLSLARALAVLEHQAKNPALKTVLSDLISEISKGAPFSEALSKHSKVFPAIFIAMVHAGEQSGTLAESLKVIATQMDSAYSLDRRVRGALMYPAVIVTAMVIIAVLMLIFVIPTLLKTFTELNVELPLSTRVVLGISNLFQNHGLLALTVILIIGGIAYWWSKKPIGKRVFHRLLIITPVIGNLVQEVNTARTARTLSSLMEAGVDVVESMNITASVVQNVHFRDVLEKSAASIKKGDLMSKTFTEYGQLYPLFFSEMMSVGEETGKTGEMLLGVAKYYEEDVDQKTKDMSTVIEPFLILFIGAAVGFFAISMIQPMYSLVDAI